MNYKDTKPYMSAFLSVDLLTDFAAFCLTDFIDWRYIHSGFVFSTQLVNCCPHGHGRRNYTCVLLPLYFTFSQTSSSLPPFPNVQYIQTVCDIGGGGEEVGGVDMYCVPYSARVLHSVSDQIQNLQNCFTTPNKMTSKDDIKGLVSLKFLRPCWPPIPLSAQRVCTPRNSPGGEGDGGSIFWKTREIGLPSYSKICTLCFHLSTLMRILLFTSMRIRIHLSTLKKNADQDQPFQFDEDPDPAS